MKAVKVAIAAAVVAAMFLALPFVSVASDAAWIDDNEKAVYFEGDPDKMTWEKFSPIYGKTDASFAKELMQIMGFDNRDSYSYTDMTYTITEMYMGEASSLAEKEVTYVKIVVQSIDFEFTAKSNAKGNMFVSTLDPYTSDINEYLGVDGKVAVGDTFTISGTFYMNQVAKSVESYMDFDDAKAGMYASNASAEYVVDLSSSVNFVRDTSEKSYDYSLNDTRNGLKSLVYDIGEDAEVLTTDSYAYVDSESVKEIGTLNFNFDKEDHAYVVTNIDNNNSKAEYGTIESVDNYTIKNKDVKFENLIKTPLDPDQLKTALSGIGTVSDKYSDVDNAYENFVNPAETPVNQGLFFGLFIAILVIVVIIALFFREKDTE